MNHVARSESVRPCVVGSHRIGALDGPLVILAGTCVIESRDHALSIAKRLYNIGRRVGLPIVFKASYDKANRTSLSSYRGPGLTEGLATLAEIKSATGMSILTDVHEPSHCEPAAAVADMLQIPAFLCRQTDLLLAAAATGRAVNVKKGQFLAPEDMGNIVDKLEAGGCKNILLTERGSSFGYHRLINDMHGLATMRAKGVPVCFDATHSVQLPGGLGTATGGRREAIPVLARAATAVGIDALFLETHDFPELALSDGPNAIPIDDVEPLLERIKSIDELVRRPLGSIDTIHTRS